jgi:hypothetical protein
LLVVADGRAIGEWLGWSRRLATHGRIVVLQGRGDSRRSLHFGLCDDLTCCSPTRFVATVLSCAQLAPVARGRLEELVSAAAEVHWHSLTSRVQELRGHLESPPSSKILATAVPRRQEWEAIERLTDLLVTTAGVDLEARLRAAKVSASLGRLLAILLGDTTRDALQTAVDALRAIEDGSARSDGATAIDAQWPVFRALKHAGDDATIGE